MNKIRVVLADDHEIVRNGIKQLLESEPQIEVVGEAVNGLEAIDRVNQLQPDILITDISMPKMDGIEATSKLNEQGTSTRIIILSMFDKEEYVLKAVELGAYGYLLKDTGKERFIKAIFTVNEGEKYFGSEISNIIINEYLSSKKGGGSASSGSDDSKKPKNDLTKRETEILTLIVRGFNNKKIADEFNISVRTIETHRLNIMKKLQVNNAAELVRVAIENNLVDM